MTYYMYTKINRTFQDICSITSEICIIKSHFGRGVNSLMAVSAAIPMPFIINVLVIPFQSVVQL